MLFIGGLLASCGLVVSFGLNLLLFDIAVVLVVSVGLRVGFRAGTFWWICVEVFVGCLWFDVRDRIGVAVIALS